MIKALLPNQLKVQIKIALRFVKDLCSGHLFRFAKANSVKDKFSFEISRTQDFKPSSTLDSKIFNLKKASQKVSSVLIEPEQIFSFWNIVGSPTHKNGFQSGRTIVEGELSETIGGGLCQLSGLIYYLSLEAGLIIIERHNHSVDLYNEETRYTPLGSDATVVYGYKDLLIKNPYTFPIYFDFIITNQEISIFLRSEKKIRKNLVEFS